MFFKKLFFLSICFLGILHAELPNEFFIKERHLSWTTAFDISCQEGKLGTVFRKPNTPKLEYYFEDGNQQLVSKATQHIVTLGSDFKIEDDAGRPLGTVVERRRPNLSSTFEIFSPAGIKLAKSQGNLWDTIFTIEDPVDGHLIATFCRPCLSFLLNNWKVTIEDTDAINKNKIHPDLFLVLTALQADIGYWRCTKENDCKAQSFLEELGPYRETLAQIEPRKEDFQFIEAITEDLDETNFYERAAEIFENLSLEQKSAFYLMLEALSSR